MDNSEVTEKIKEEIAKTQAQVKKYRVLTQPISPENAIGRLSRRNTINIKCVNESALRQAEQKLKNLNRVLEIAGSKILGICLKYKKPILVGRLMIRPESLYCVNCAR